MANFTPGPWVMGDENNQHAQVCLGESNCSVDLRRFADYPSCPDMSRDEMLANAHLIASAPDLYEALANLAEAIRACSHGRNPGKFLTPFVEQAEAALTKAGGPL